jgi:hypothetical protein
LVSVTVYSSELYGIVCRICIPNSPD